MLLEAQSEGVPTRNTICVSDKGRSILFKPRCPSSAYMNNMHPPSLIIYRAYFKVVVCCSRKSLIKLCCMLNS
eukprot:c32166_g1_i1 orf=3-218(-)